MMLSLSLMLASATVARADELSSARQRVDSQQTKLKYEGELVVIADRDIQTARIEQDTANREIERAKSMHDDKRLVYWSHKMEAAHHDEEDAFQRYEVHRGMREDARHDLRVASAAVHRIEVQQASR